MRRASSIFAIFISCLIGLSVETNAQIPDTETPSATPDKSLIDDVEKQTPAVNAEIMEQYQKFLKGVAERKQLEKDLARKLTGIKLIGNFTMTGQTDKPLTPEEYHIIAATKMEEGNFWKLDVRIKYGKNDRTVTLAPIAIEFAGKTPVITVDQFRIIGMGTFDARVVLRKKKYAGTWAHNQVGGHMFGRIEKLTPDEMKQKAEEEKKEDKKPQPESEKTNK